MATCPPQSQVYRNVIDYCVIRFTADCDRRARVCCIELKAQNGRLSEAQAIVKRHIEAAGHGCLGRGAVRDQRAVIGLAAGNLTGTCGETLTIRGTPSGEAWLFSVSISRMNFSASIGVAVGLVRSS